MFEVVKQRGIVLRRLFPAQQMLYVFDETEGIVKARITDRLLVQRLWPGMCIMYQIDSRTHHIVTMQQIDIFLMPTAIDYTNLVGLHRLIQVSGAFLEKQIPYKKIFFMLFTGIKFSVLDKELFISVEQWLCAVILQEVGYWQKDLFLVINAFFLKLSILIDSFIQLEVELFKEWVHDMNRTYGQRLEIWIESCIKEQVYGEK